MASDPLQYYIGKGVINFTPIAGSTLGTKRDLGNVPEFEFTPSVELLQHQSSRSGVRTTDRTVVVSRGGDVRIVMEEHTADNLAMLLLGTVTADTVGGGHTIDILSSNTIDGLIQFESTNEVGPKITMDLYNVSFQPGASLSLIGEEWNQLEITGQVQLAPAGLMVDEDDVGGKVGRMTIVKATD